MMITTAAIHMAGKRTLFQRLVGGVLFMYAALVPLGSNAAVSLVGAAAPAFTLTTYKGEKVSLDDFQGRRLILTFWATWCGPCLKELPEFQTAYEQHRSGGLEILAVNFGERPKEIARFLNKTPVDLPIALDYKADVAARYKILNLPVTFFIDHSGVIREQVLGGTLTAGKITEILERLSSTGH